MQCLDPNTKFRLDRQRFRCSCFIKRPLVNNLTGGTTSRLFRQNAAPVDQGHRQLAPYTSLTYLLTYLLTHLRWLGRAVRTGLRERVKNISNARLPFAGGVAVTPRL